MSDESESDAASVQTGREAHSGRRITQVHDCAPGFREPVARESDDLVQFLYGSRGVWRIGRSQVVGDNLQEQCRCGEHLQDCIVQLASNPRTLLDFRQTRLHVVS